MRNALVLGSALMMVVCNELMAFVTPPFGSILLPVVLTITSLLVGFWTKSLGSLAKSMLTLLFVVINDVSLRLGAGTLDSEGNGWMQLLLLVGIMPTVGILAASLYVQNKDESVVNKGLALAAFIVLFVVYIWLFNDLGM